MWAECTRIRRASGNGRWRQCFRCGTTWRVPLWTHLLQISNTYLISGRIYFSSKEVGSCIVYLYVLHCFISLVLRTFRVVSVTACLLYKESTRSLEVPRATGRYFWCWNFATGRERRQFVTWSSVSACRHSSERTNMKLTCFEYSLIGTCVVAYLQTFLCSRNVWPCRWRHCILSKCQERLPADMAEHPGRLKSSSCRCCCLLLRHI